VDELGTVEMLVAGEAARRLLAGDGRAGRLPVDFAALAVRVVAQALDVCPIAITMCPRSSALLVFAEGQIWLQTAVNGPCVASTG